MQVSLKPGMSVMLSNGKVYLIDEVKGDRIKMVGQGNVVVNQYGLKHRQHGKTSGYDIIAVEAQELELNLQWVVILIKEGVAAAVNGTKPPYRKFPTVDRAWQAGFDAVSKAIG